MITQLLFKTAFEQRLIRAYARVFSLHEIETNVILQWVFGATILSYFITFAGWIGNSATTLDAVARGSYVCWPHFQQCADFLFLRALPEGYSQSFFYMALFGTLVFAVYAIYHRDWTMAHIALIPSFLWHVWVSLFITFTIGGNYDYYLAAFAFITLFLPHKEFFLKLALVLFYFLSTVAKLHETWVLGTYFSALKTGLPLFPDWSIPLWTNLVIFMEMVAAWFLLSSKPVLQRSVLAFFILFHLYSGILVGFRYPATVLPTLIILFGPLYRPSPVPLDTKSIAGWLLVILMFIGQFTPVMIPGDEKLTHEGNRLGLYMFEANHQCISTVTTHYTDGSTRTSRQESISARSRCEPYRYWFRIKNACTAQHGRIERMEWAFDHSINGGAFLRIVDVEDACALSYEAFGRNEWIKTENDSPRIMGYPVENIYE